jgi:hypothetical protein
MIRRPFAPFAFPRAVLGGAAVLLAAPWACSAGGLQSSGDAGGGAASSTSTASAGGVGGQAGVSSSSSGDIGFDGGLGDASDGGCVGDEPAVLIIAEWSADTVGVYEVDAQGDPIVPTRQDFFTYFQKPWGAYFEPETGDYVFLTWGPSPDRVYVVQGFVPPPPPPPPPA